MVHAPRNAFIEDGMRGSPKTQHVQKWSLNPLSDWKLYENPFFRQGYLVPDSAPPRCHSSSHPRLSTSSSSATVAQCASGSSDFVSAALSPKHSVETHEACEAAATGVFLAHPPLHLPSLDKDKFMSGSIVSARKLAASFWEQYGVQALEKPTPVHQASHAEAQHLHSVPPPRRTLCPSSPLYCEIPETLEDTRKATALPSESNMASCQTAALANVLHRVRSVEEIQSRHTAVLQKLKSDVEAVARHVRELEFSQSSALKEVNCLLQKFGEQMVISRRKEQEKVRLAFLHLRQEMEEEKNACRLLKLQNKKLAKDLTNANIATADACEELEKERKAREMLEEVCNELAREIGEDKAEVEHLKQEQEESRKRLEEELKMMRMLALWQDEMVKKGNVSEMNVRLLEGNGKQCMPVKEELRSKLRALVDLVGACPHEGALEMSDKQAEQARLNSQARQLVDLQPSRELEDEADKPGLVTCLANGVACSNACSSGQENVSKMVGIVRSRDAGICGHGEQELSSGAEQRVLPVSRAQRPHRSRRSMRLRGQQRHHFDQRSSEFWENRGNSAWMSSEDEATNQGQLITCRNHMLQVGHVVAENINDHDHRVNASSNGIWNNESLLADGRRAGLVSPSESAIAKESPRPRPRSHRRHVGSSHFGSGGHPELSRKLEADIASSMPYSRSEDEAMSCMMRASKLKGKQESALHAGRGQEQRLSNGVRDEDYLVYHHNDNLGSHRSTGGSGMASADTELDLLYYDSVKRASNVTTTHDQLSNIEVPSDQDTGIDAIRMTSFISNHTFPSSQEGNQINAEGSADSGGHETMKRISPRRLASAKSQLQPRFWLPSPDAFSIFGGSAKCSPRSVQEERRQREVTSSSGSGLHPCACATEGSMAKESANEQPPVDIKGNSLGAQLIKARELDGETKPAKSFFRFSPLRRAVSYG